jgi:hypothetical protein
VNSDVDQILRRIREHAAAMRAVRSGDEEVRVARMFMGAVYDLGRAINGGAIRRDDPILHEVVAQTAPELTWFHPRLQQYISNTESHLVSNDEEGLEIPAYIKAARNRSAVEFLRELYANSPYGEFLTLLDTRDLDEVMRERGKAIGWLPADAVPADIPTEHSWWIKGSRGAAR